MMASGDRKGRLIEIAISVAASIVSSALVMAWTMSATFTELRTKLNEQERIVNINTQEIRALGSRDVSQIAQQSATDAHYQDILRRLDSIDRKLEAN